MKIGDTVKIDYSMRGLTYSNYHTGVIVGEGQQFGHPVWIVDVTWDDGFNIGKQKFYKNRDGGMWCAPILATCWSKIVNPEVKSCSKTAQIKSTSEAKITLIVMSILVLGLWAIFKIMK